MPSHKKIPIDWADMDLYGHVNNIAYFRYIQAARVHLCGNLGLRTQAADMPIGFTVASVSCEFLKELQYPGEAVVETSVVKIGNTSFELVHEIRDAEGKLAARGRDVLVVYDYDKKQKVAIWNKLRKEMEKYLKFEQE